MSRTPDELAEKAWTLIEQALTEGKMVLDNGTIFPVDTEMLVDLAIKLSAPKIKKPQLVNVPEGFNLKPTTGDSDAEEEA